MEGKYQYLKDLIRNKDDNKIKVRITREWEAINPTTKHLINKNYVITDEEGTLYHVPVMLNQIDDYTKRIQIGKVYMISDFAVVAANKSYRPVCGDKVINFTRKTVVEPQGNESTIPKYGFQMKSFEQARSMVGGIIDLFDVTGKLIKYSNIEHLRSDKQKLDILLQDDTGDEITVTLWGDQAHKFEELKPQYQRPNVVLIVTGTKAITYNANITLSSTTATQYYINIDHPMVEKLRKKGMNDDMVPFNTPPTQIPGQLKLANIDNLNIKQLSGVQLPDGKEAFFCSVVATVVDIVPNFGWHYSGCDKCHKTMEHTTQCNKCTNKDTNKVLIYHVNIKVRDATSTTTFSLFNTQVMELVNVPAQHVLDNDEDATPVKIPSLLNNIVGRKFCFYLKLTSYNTVQEREYYTAVKLQEIKDDDLPQRTSEPSEEINEIKNGSGTNSQLQNPIPKTGKAVDAMTKKATRTYIKRKEKNTPDMEDRGKTKKIKNVIHKESQVPVEKKMQNTDKTNETQKKANTAKNKHSNVTIERKNKPKKLNDTAPMDSKVHTDNKGKAEETTKSKKRTYTKKK